MTRLRNYSPLITALDSLAALSLAVAAVVWVNLPLIPHGGLTAFLRIRVTLLNLSFAVVFAILWKQCLTFLQLYDHDLDGLRRLLGRTAAGVAIMTGVLALYLQARHARGPVEEILATFFITAFLCELCRVIVCSRHVSLQMDEPERVVIMGSGRLASKAWRELRMQHHGHRQLLGFIDDRDPAAMAPDIAHRLIGTVDDLPAYLLQNVVDELIIAAPMRSCYDVSQQAVSIAEAAGLRVLCLHDVFAVTQHKALRPQGSLFVELVPHGPRRSNAETLKRAFDLLGASAGILLLAPVFLLISLAIKITSRGSIFSVHERHGYRRRRFRMITFRCEPESPKMQGAKQGRALAHHLGSFLEHTLLCNLPELWNVLLGDMSLVGPQPMSAGQVSLLRRADLLRHFSVRPGLTGAWQVAGPSTLNFEQGMALDSAYIDEWSLALDLKILLRAVPVLLKRAAADF